MALSETAAGRSGEQQQWLASGSALADLDALELVLRSPLGTVIHDEAGRVVAANRAFADLLGYDLADTTSLTAHDVIYPSDIEVRDADAARLVSGQIQTLSTRRRLQHRDGSAVAARVYKSTLRMPGHHWVLVQLIDARQEQQKLALLEHAATHDALTGLLNRAGLLTRLEEWLATSDELVALLVDLDDFKDVNDTYGHAAGDRVLQQVSARLQAAVPSGSLVSRLAGDEFVLVLDDADTERLTDRLRTVLHQPIRIDGDRQVQVSASIGAVRTRDLAEPLMVIAAADRAMYDAKRTGNPAEASSRLAHAGALAGAGADRQVDGAPDGVERRTLRLER